MFTADSIGVQCKMVCKRLVLQSINRRLDFRREARSRGPDGRLEGARKFEDDRNIEGAHIINIHHDVRRGARGLGNVHQNDYHWNVHHFNERRK